MAKFSDVKTDPTELRKRCSRCGKPKQTNEGGSISLTLRTPNKDGSMTAKGSAQVSAFQRRFCESCAVEVWGATTTAFHEAIRPIE